MENSSNLDIWSKAPENAYHWERFPNGKCVWHCRDENGQTTSKKAPNFDIDRKSLWRDAEKQKEADQMNENIRNQLAKVNVVLA